MPRPRHAQRPRGPDAAPLDGPESASPNPHGDAAGAREPSTAPSSEPTEAVSAMTVDETDPAEATGATVPADASRQPAEATGATVPADASRQPPESPDDVATKPTARVSDFGTETRPELEAPVRRATLVRAGDAPKDPGVAANAYLDCVIDSRYRIESVIGRGGMGVVYRAKHEIIDKLVAIKILLPTEDEDVIARFVNEAKAATAIGNPHIVDTIDFGRLPDESTYFAMEYLEGETLATIIRKAGFLPVERAMHIAKQIAEGMAAAHAATIVHRDLKPENVFVTPHGKEPDFVKLLDFGIAKVASIQNRITRAGTIFGTPHYMSPEQAAGTEVDHRSDIYSLGVMLYEMLCGKVPFDAENAMGLLTQHMYSPPKPLSELADPPQPLSIQLDAIVLKCLSKRPERRYQSMREIIDDIERVEQGTHPIAFDDLLQRDSDEHLAHVQAAMRAARTGRRRPWLWIATGIACVGIGSGLVIAYRWDAVRPLPTPPSADTTTASEQATQGSESTRKVALVFSPIDAEVFQDGKSLGGMPVNVEIPHGKQVHLIIKRDGFYPEPVTLDGSRSVVVVRLEAIQGQEPAVPVPEEPSLDDLVDIGVEEASAAMLLRMDAGAKPARSRPIRIDAGAAAATPPPRPPKPKDKTIEPTPHVDRPPEPTEPTEPTEPRILEPVEPSNSGASLDTPPPEKPPSAPPAESETSEPE